MKISALLASTALAVSFSSTAFGYVLTGPDAIDVGELDTFVSSSIQSDLGNANPETEQDWVESVLGYSVTLEGKNEPVEIFTTQDSDSVVAFNLEYSPGLFVVKDGQDFVLFENNPSLDWGVLDLNEYFGLNKLEDLQFSHVTEFNGQPTVVPEPSTLALLGLGLVAVGAGSRRRARQA